MNDALVPGAELLAFNVKRVHLASSAHLMTVKVRVTLRY